MEVRTFKVAICFSFEIPNVCFLASVYKHKFGKGGNHIHLSLSGAQLSEALHSEVGKGRNLTILKS